MNDDSSDPRRRARLRPPGTTDSARIGPDGLPASDGAAKPDSRRLGHREPSLGQGDVLADRFLVVRFIARGGMSEVYEATDLDLDTRVALKVLRPELARDGAAVERLKREIQLARQVTHPNVCRVFDVFRQQLPGGAGGDIETLGFTMELLPGETLSSRLARTGALGTDEALDVVRQVAAALDAAHRAGVVHRDFKSGNIMLVQSGHAHEPVRAVVTDFGLARSAPRAGVDHARLTEPDVVMGTADYMAPEQAQGAEATPASDIYALGVVMFEMITGARPHSGETPVALLINRVRELPRSPRDFVADLDDCWESVILSCLDPEPSRRFRRAGDIVTALEGCGAPVSRPSGRPGGPQIRPSDGPRDSGPGRSSRLRWRRLALAAALGVITLGAVVVGLLVVGEDPHSSRGPLGLRTSQLTTWPSLEIDPCFSADERSIAFSANRTGKFEIHIQRLTTGSEPVQLTDDGEQNFQPAWSPDGQWIAYASHGRGGIWLIPALGGTVRRLTDFGSHPAWSPDGSRVAFQSTATAELSVGALTAMPPSTIWLVDVRGGEPLRLTRPGEPAGGHGGPAWAPDGRRLVFTASAQRRSLIWSMRTDGSGLTPVTEGDLLAFDPQWCPHGEHLYFSAVSQEQRYGVWRLPISSRSGRPTGAPISIVNLGMASIRNFALASTCRRMVFTAMSTISNLWSVPISKHVHEPTGEARPLTSGSGRNSRPLLSPDGSLIIFDGWRVGSSRDIWSLRVDGGELAQLTFAPDTDTNPSWFPDGDRFAFLSDREGGLALWTLHRRTRECTRLMALPPHTTWVRTSPDGRRIAYHSTVADGTTNLWVTDIDGGNARQLTFDQEAMAFPAWSPDGRLLAFEMQRGDNDFLMTVPATGGEPTRLVSDAGKSWPNSWSPDGRRIAFAGLRDGYWNIWWVDRESRRQRQLTTMTRLDAYVRYPAWSPRDDQVVFEVAESQGDLWLADNLP